MRELSEVLDSNELTEWLAFDRLEPLPVGDNEVATLCASVYRAAGIKVKAEDFSRAKRVRRIQSAEEGKARLGAFMTAYNLKQKQLES